MENLLAKLLFYQPENPVSFMETELENLMKLRENSARPAPSLFTDANVTALFNKYDVNHTGVIDAKQYADAFKTLALPLHVTPEAHYTKAQFLDDVRASLNLKTCAFY
ncbi:EF-hand calcium-binding domain-containing protein 10 [Amphibalanus amphitrite]|uniref:EF-hand calcium-binding domain-containing protein 10 n=1 Tax=Amphibalanus amphitrite TaxID=1232801 RepID=A0A6A4WRI9_AMPAM|nr:EF-hand calcium-binding domain-containing protein 10 [Amphibalanus amphitrite]